MSSKRSGLISAAKLRKLVRERDALLAFVRDIADHGLRCDTRPSMSVGGKTAEDRDQNSVLFLYDYIGQRDREMRKRAQTTLNLRDIIKVAPDREFLRRIVDAAWSRAMESEQVPCTSVADKIIDSVLYSGPEPRTRERIA